MDLQLLSGLLKNKSSQVKDLSTQENLELDEMAGNIFARSSSDRMFAKVREHCERGFYAEKGVMNVLTTPTSWTRPSPQSNFDERKYDIEITVLEDFRNRVEKVYKLEVKSIIGQPQRYFEFNRFKNHGGLSLKNFLSNAHETEYLIVAGVADHWEEGKIVVPMFAFHRKAFGEKFIQTSSRTFGCDSYIWYDTAIANGDCIKLQG